MQHPFSLLLLAGLAKLGAFVNASPFPDHLVNKSFFKRDGTVVTALTLSEDSTSYNIIAYVGNPAQTVSVQLDTGSSDFWVLAPGACDTSSCTCPPEGCTYFDVTQSTTAELYEDQAIVFDGSYGSGAASGYYITDDVTIGSAMLTSEIIAVVTADVTEPRGIMGVGLEAGEGGDAPNHPGIVETLYTQGDISSQSYSLYLNQYATGVGEIIFGGIDSSLFTGSLVPLPIIASPDNDARLTVEWSTLEIFVNGASVYQSILTTSQLNGGAATLMDSGTTLADIPQDVFDQMEIIFDLEYDQDDEVWLGACSIATLDAQLVFGFGTGPDVYITVAASEIVRPFDGTYCLFGFQPSSDPSGLLILGDVFLTSAYAFFDFDTYTISLAQASWS